MDILENGISENIIKQKYPITGKGNFETNSRDIIREIGQEKLESVYLLTYFIDRTYRFERIADGESGEVSFDMHKIQLRKGIAGYVIYHNHPPANESTLSPPSSDDFITATRIHSPSIVHKIITEYGIWKYQAIDIKKAQDISLKLGTLFNYLDGNFTPLEISERTKKLEGLNSAYAIIASTYKKLMKEKDPNIVAKFKEAIFQLGFIVDFEEFQ